MSRIGQQTNQASSINHLHHHSYFLLDNDWIAGAKADQNFQSLQRTDYYYSKPKY
jgi:hypothetical protein